jgi:hypothetical protein
MVVLVILTLLKQAISLAPALVTVLALGIMAVRHQRLFLALFVILEALESTRDFAPSIGMNFGGISAYPDDLFMVLCASAALVRIRQWRLRGITIMAALVFSVLVGLGVISWIWTFGLQRGVNSWRSEMLIVAVLLYATTRPRDWSWNDIHVLIVWPAIVAAIAGLVSILLFGLGSSSSTVLVGGVLEYSRPVGASGSLLMLVGLWVTLLSVGKWTATHVFVGLLLVSMILITQNRSVWVAAICGVVVWWLVPRIRARGTSTGLGGLSRTVIVFLVATATALVGVSVNVLGQSASNGGTWLWRVTRWAASMSIPRSWIEWLAGSALGPTPASTPGVFPTFAHSFYVDDIEKTGFIGLAALVFLIIAVGKAHVPSWSGPLGLIVCISYLSYGTAYQVPAWAWMLVGIILSTTLIEQPEGPQDGASPNAGSDRATEPRGAQRRSVRL